MYFLRLNDNYICLAVKAVLDSRNFFLMITQGICRAYDQVEFFCNLCSGEGGFYSCRLQEGPLHAGSAIPFRENLWSLGQCGGIGSSVIPFCYLSFHCIWPTLVAPSSILGIISQFGLKNLFFFKIISVAFMGFLNSSVDLSFIILLFPFAICLSKRHIHLHLWSAGRLFFVFFNILMNYFCVYFL